MAILIILRVADPYIKPVRKRNNLNGLLPPNQSKRCNTTDNAGANNLQSLPPPPSSSLSNSNNKEDCIENFRTPLIRSEK